MRRLTSRVVLPVPAPAMTTTLRSNVVSACSRWRRSGIWFCLLIFNSLCSNGLDGPWFGCSVRAPPGRSMLAAAGGSKFAGIAIAIRQDEVAPGLDPFHQCLHGTLKQCAHLRGPHSSRKHGPPNRLGPVWRQEKELHVARSWLVRDCQACVQRWLKPSATDSGLNKIAVFRRLV